MTPSPEVSRVPTPFKRIHASGHSINRVAHAIARGDDVPHWARDEAVKLVLMSADIPPDIDAVQALVVCYEEDLRGLVQEAMERERYISALEATIKQFAAKPDEPYTVPLPIPLSREPRRVASGE